MISEDVQSSPDIVFGQKNLKKIVLVGGGSGGEQKQIWIS